MTKRIKPPYKLTVWMDGKPGMVNVHIDQAREIARHFCLIKSKPATRRVCTKCGTHLSDNAPEDSCLCHSAINIMDATNE